MNIVYDSIHETDIVASMNIAQYLKVMLPSILKLVINFSKTFMNKINEIVFKWLILNQNISHPKYVRRLTKGEIKMINLNWINLSPNKSK